MPKGKITEISPEEVAEGRQGLIEAIRARKAHLHYSILSKGPQWVVIVIKEPTSLCGTDRCVPL